MTVNTEELRRLHGAATAGEWCFGYAGELPVPRFVIAEGDGCEIYSSGEGISCADDYAAIAAFKNAIPELCDTADRLARIEAVLVGDEATIETLALAMLKAEIGNNEDYFAHAWGHEREAWIRDATAALAALRELIGRPA